MDSQGIFVFALIFSSKKNTFVWDGPTSGSHVQAFSCPPPLPPLFPLVTGYSIGVVITCHVVSDRIQN